ncbi:MAG: ABC transporter permease [Anaerolineales bacterium]
MEETNSLNNPLSGLEDGQIGIKQVSTWTRLRRSKSAMIGLVIIGFLILVALLADNITPQGINEQDLRKGYLPPSSEFWLGTDKLGRDLYSRIVHGSRVSLQVGIIATAISAVVGIILGAIAGYWGGKIDTVIQAMIDISWAFPTVLLALFLIAVMGSGLTNLMIAVGFSYWGGFARVVRGQVLSLKEWEFVTAAKAVGASQSRIIIRYILPNLLPIVIVMSTLMMADAILIESTLSFLGLGAQRPIPSWGSILSSGRGDMHRALWVTVYPGIAIMLTVLGFNLLGDGLRDALDPRLRNK